MATDHEYTRSLRQRVRPLITGVGPVEAAVGLTDALARLAAGGRAPDLVVALGSAGSRALDHAAIYQAASVAYRDMDCTPLGFPIGVTPFLDLPAALALGPALPGLASATLASGGSIVSGADYDRIDADMVDMETYAYARAAGRFGAALISLRGISDGRAPLGGLSDWTETLDVIGDGLSDAVARLEELLRANALAIGPAPRVEPLVEE
jgi:adenosylhomocysteine nucleosidase